MRVICNRAFDLSGPIARTRTLRERQSDDRLLELACVGDERAFEVLVERHRPLLLAHCRALVGEPAAQDAVQQAFISAWHALLRGHEVRHPRAWLHAIAHRAALRTVRERGASAEVPLEIHAEEAPAAGLSTEEEFERSATAHAALAALAGLPPRERTALEDTSLRGRSGREAARALGVSEQSLRQLVFHARARARAAMGSYALTGFLARAPAWLAERARRVGTHAQDGFSIGSAHAGEALVKLAPLLITGALLTVPAVTLELSRRGTPRRALAGSASPLTRASAPRAPRAGPHRSARVVARLAPQAPARATRTRGGAEAARTRIVSASGATSTSVTQNAIAQAPAPSATDTSRGAAEPPASVAQGQLTSVEATGHSPGRAIGSPAERVAGGLVERTGALAESAGQQGAALGSSGSTAGSAPALQMQAPRIGSRPDTGAGSSSPPALP